MACSGADDDRIGGRTEAIYGFDGEDTTEPFMFPFVVQIGDSSCTGTLISPSHVLTAAHCVNPTPGYVSFAAQVGSIARENKFSVVRCWQHEEFIARNEELILGSVLPGLTNAEKAAELHTQCGVLRHAQFALAGAVPSDVAVLQLDRPVPHAGLDPSTISAGDVFVDSVPLVTVPPADTTSFTGTAVGYGETSSGTGSGTRRFKEFSVVMRPSVISGGTLGLGDSGGPLLFDPGTGWEVVGVASTQDKWTSLGSAATRDWIVSKLDVDHNGRVDTHCARRSRVGSDPSATASNDHDGDGYLDTVDSCPATYNPCQERSDMDGDGVDDDCDACPATASVAAPRGNHPGVPDADGDEVPDACDCEPSEEDWGDIDHDYVRDGCDSCIREWNPFQENRDGDIFGDACDGCPYTPNTGADSDMDGVPNRCDNCLVVPNADQANCNLDTEAWITDPEDEHERPFYYVCDPADEEEEDCFPEEHNYGVGDACDPQPCGETTVVRPTDTYRVEVDALVDGNVPARTGFRFCRCYGARHDTLDDRQRCLDTQTDPDATGNCGISDLDAYDSLSEGEHWRQVSLEHLSVDGVDPSLVGSGRREESILGYTSPGTSFDLDGQADWSVETDIERWRSDFGEIVPFGVVPMRGVLWTHTPGDEGADFEESPEAAPTRVLTSHYYSVGASGPIPFDPRPAPPCVRFIGPFFEPGLCPLCGTDGPAPWLVAPAFGDCLFEPGLPEGWPIIQFRENWLEWDELWDPEWEDPLDPLPECLDPEHPEWEETRWVAASDAHLAGPGQSLRYVRMHVEGATVVRTLMVGPEGLSSEECTNTGDPPPRGGFSAVASARRNQVWIAGGDGFHDVWAYDIGSGVWTQLVDDERLGTILAITYDGVSDRLLVLTGAGAYAELLELAPDGTTRVLGSWARTGAMDTFGLVVDPRGNAYITSSNGEEYCAMLLTPVEDSYEMHGAMRDAGYLPSDAVFGDLRGLTGLVYREEAFRSLEHSPSTFEPPGSWVNEECM